LTVVVRLNIIEQFALNGNQIRIVYIRLYKYVYTNDSLNNYNYNKVLIYNKTYIIGNESVAHKIHLSHYYY